MNKIYYHVRCANGVTVDWTTDKVLAVNTARSLNCECYEVNAVTGSAKKLSI